MLLEEISHPSPILIRLFLKKVTMINKAQIVKDFLDVVAKDAACTLDYTTDYSLLIASMLSAQCTDKKVNAVTKVLFSDYQSLVELDKASLLDIENHIKSLGLYKNKAKYIKGITHDLLTRFNGSVPNGKKEMMTLPGIGNKTANVMLIEWFKVPEFPVDTHVNRVVKRLGFANESDSVLDVEKKLCMSFDEKDWIDLHHKFIYFGRNICKAQSPLCAKCKLHECCKYFKT